MIDSVAAEVNGLAIHIVIEQLKLSRGAGVRLFTKLGLPAGLLDAADDSPDTFLKLILVDLELGNPDWRRHEVA